ncbi:hypothetical protein [Streptomyces sp. RKAG337]|uniref:hypothetical protein n=1 Tax=Streptomyces sp. RKAG337 TaxID=2893404 RepID=UPI002034137A|nr:hypothetical protein [Streptomyces sp. RKAG337]MCM2427058.1 hypothetical protein [Streptomyces sp. RKAG337]
MTDQSIASQDEKPQDEKPQNAEPQDAEPQAVEPEPQPQPEPAAEGVPPVPPVPPLPVAPPPADAWAAPVPPVEPKKPRRVLRAVLRWTSAVLVFGALGGGVAYGITQPERTRIPGLETPDDGRWTYQPLALPKLPAGKPAVGEDQLNRGGRHYADLRSLLLPAPEGATPDPAFPGAKGWLPTDKYLTLFGKDTQAPQRGFLTQEGLRHIAARAWTMPDGTRAETYLLQFSSAAYSDRYRIDFNTTHLAQVPDVRSDLDSALGAGEAGASILYAFEGQGPHGIQVRYAFISAGDTIGVVVLSHKDTMPVAPFRQTITLQAQLLG